MYGVLRMQYEISFDQIELDFEFLFVLLNDRVPVILRVFDDIPDLDYIL